mmetsp:Transcript_8418/g.26793  ORF Transcript_8418/g.26793 Transcript_8418/m.26793 type:complete len:212 (+) Transcript_8418:596-1231(+)
MARVPMLEQALWFMPRRRSRSVRWPSATSPGTSASRRQRSVLARSKPRPRGQRSRRGNGRSAGRRAPLLSARRGCSASGRWPRPSGGGGTRRRSLPPCGARRTVPWRTPDRSRSARRPRPSLRALATSRGPASRRSGLQRPSQPRSSRRLARRRTSSCSGASSKPRAPRPPLASARRPRPRPCGQRRSARPRPPGPGRRRRGCGPRARCGP